MGSARSLARMRLRITTANICGSDLHPYEGRASLDAGMVLGHENMGVVEEVGPGVNRIRPGDRVSAPFNIACGSFNFGQVFDKGISMGQGQCPVKRHNRQLRDLIIRSRATPSTIVSHELPLEQAPKAYDQFDKRVDGWTKVALRPAA